MPYRKTFSHTSSHKNISTYRHSYSSASPKTMDMTNGNILSKLIVFVIPLMITNLLQMLYNAADMIIVSLSSEPDAVGAIGITSSFINLVINIFIGFSTGANVIVARHLGAKDEDNASRAVHTAISMSVIFGLVGTVVGFFISRPVLSSMGAEGRLLELSTTYTLIYFSGAAFLSLTNYLISIFRAKGDTRTPLVILSISGVVNVALNAFFVLGCKMSVEGVAIATVISNALSAAVLLFVLSQSEDPSRFSFKRLCLDRRSFIDIVHIGLPAGIQGSLFALSNMMIQSSILQVNNAVCPPDAAFAPIVRGSSVSTNLENFIYIAQNSVYQGAITFTSQNAGAKKHKRIYRILLCSYLLGSIIAATFALLIFVARNPLLNMYNVADGVVGSLEHLAYQSAILRLYMIALPYFIIPFMEVGCGVIRGLGKSISSTIISLFGACFFRILWIYTVFRAVFDKLGSTEPMKALASIYLSYPISWILTGAVFLACVLRLLKKLTKDSVEAV